ncbi:MAG TPA: TrkA C-terminal domain-containing protein [Nitrospira sp.]|nr:TrkA C-terminal domain-containing protein [Nitrospira sp.]
MSLEFVGRLQKELSLTGSAVYESVLAIAERVNRKVRVLRLHGQASSLLTEIEAVYQQLGRRIAGAISVKNGTVTTASAELERVVSQALDRIHRLKQTLVQVDAEIRELKMETIHEDLLRLQRDLALRSGALERFAVGHGSRASGKTVAELAIPASVRVVTVFRGPFLIAPTDGLLLRPDDVVIAVGLRADLDQVAALFSVPRKAKPVS